MIIQQALKVGKMPPKIADAPDLRLGLEIYYAGFFDLIACRSGGFGDGPISYSSIIEYARAAEFDPDQTDDLVFYIAKLDEVYMDHVRKKKPKGNKQAPPPPVKGKTSR